MRLSQRQRLFLLTLPLLFTSCILVSSCILVRVEGELPEDEWLSDVVHGGELTPASFRHGRSDLSFVGTVFGKNAELEMKFSCEPDEVEAYLDGVSAELQARLEEERDAKILKVRSERDLSREIEYDGEDGYGEVKVEIIELAAGGRYAYRLEIDWHE